LIRIYQYDDILGKNVQEYSCPECCKSLQWVSTMMSPFKCEGCKQKIIDISKIIKQTSWRIEYHLKGKEAVKCGCSVLPLI